MGNLSIGNVPNFLWANPTASINPSAPPFSSPFLTAAAESEMIPSQLFYYKYGMERDRYMVMILKYWSNQECQLYLPRDLIQLILKEFLEPKWTPKAIEVGLKFKNITSIYQLYNTRLFEKCFDVMDTKRRGYIDVNRKGNKLFLLLICFNIAYINATNNKQITTHEKPDKRDLHALLCYCTDVLKVFLAEKYARRQQHKLKLASTRTGTPTDDTDLARKLRERRQQTKKFLFKKADFLRDFSFYLQEITTSIRFKLLQG
ncbi:hypothetical protein RFI_19905 [Reticulomyxa filosa]|uniref:Uncharacterized protein n=1 Tax=Reticulomyxa filosa TaxID=46433 RepID=X6MUV8_RETFI|nr:hypothetical protein RFI_19905 [Reticulomyxa filosa]|eukprot:ETO17416.1 hypothetical protein RFI_19905 [Reticulomyxa filosa]